MKITRLLVVIASCAFLVGCSGLSVAWVLQASYNSPAITQAQIITEPETRK